MQANLERLQQSPDLLQVVAFNAATPDANVDRASPLVVEAQEVSKPRLKGHLHVVAAFRSDQPQTPHYEQSTGGEP